jgi:hypothetical protein
MSGLQQPRGQGCAAYNSSLRWRQHSRRSYCSNRPSAHTSGGFISVAPAATTAAALGPEWLANNHRRRSLSELRHDHHPALAKG